MFFLAEVNLAFAATVAEVAALQCEPLRTIVLNTMALSEEFTGLLPKVSQRVCVRNVYVHLLRVMYN